MDDKVRAGPGGGDGVGDGDVVGDGSSSWRCNLHPCSCLVSGESRARDLASIHPASWARFAAGSNGIGWGQLEPGAAAARALTLPHYGCTAAQHQHQRQRQHRTSTTMVDRRSRTLGVAIVAGVDDPDPGRHGCLGLADQGQGQGLWSGTLEFCLG